MQTATEGEQVFSFTGGAPCLDFCNTMSGSRVNPRERLHAFADLVAWGRQAGFLSDADAVNLARFGAAHPRAAARTLADAVALREAIFRIFVSVIEDSTAAEGDLTILNSALGRALKHLRLAPHPDGCGWAWLEDREQLDRMLWPVARSAADLLVSEERRQVRRCGGDNCDWLFIDHSRNHSRRWCDMRDCGNRAKARRFYARKKAGA